MKSDDAARLAQLAVETVFQAGVSLQQRGDLAQAKACYQRVLGVQPDHAGALQYAGVIAWQAKDFAGALALLERAARAAPQDPAIWLNRGMALRDVGQAQAALESYTRAIEIAPGFAEAYLQRGVVWRELSHLDAALQDYDLALTLNPALPLAHFSRGNLMREFRRHQEAVTSYDRAIALRPDLVPAHANRGNSLSALRQHEAAIESYDRAIALAPGFAHALLNRGVALNEMGRAELALASLDAALRLDSQIAQAHFARGNVLRGLGQYEAAAQSYERAAELDQGGDLGLLISSRMWTCDWRHRRAEMDRLEDGIRNGDTVSSPFSVLVVCDSPALQRRAAELWLARNVPRELALASFRKRLPGERIRIGYFSADFHTHATMHLMAGLLECHDKSAFEIIAFSFGPSVQDAMRQRVASACDRFIEVGHLSDPEIARTSRELGVDIAVDLKGFTQDCRPGIFAARCAALQVNYLGYPGTLGADYIDYLIADTVLVPPDAAPHYAEQIVYLPHTYQVNDNRRPSGRTSPSRTELGLPDDGFVFCCFNNNYKITPETFDVWMRLLKTVEGSVLWLLADNAGAQANLEHEARRRGIDPQRLVFAARTDLAGHLARHAQADLFLDTWPCNAHTTASDALWAGLPLLTCIGQSFVSRVSASLLQAVDMAELVTETPDHYEALACELATDAGRLRQLRERLAQRRLTSPLFDTPLFTRHLEAAYRAMIERQSTGLPPAPIRVAAGQALAGPVSGDH